jgi:hypothetical protein
MNKDAARPAGCRGEAWLKKGLLSSKQVARRAVADGLLADPTRILAGRVPMPPWAVMTCGPPADPSFRKRPNWRALRSGLPYAARAGRPNGADTKAPPLPRAPSCITERAAAHSLQLGTYALSAAGLLAALAVRPVPSCALPYHVPRMTNYPETCVQFRAAQSPPCA